MERADRQIYLFSLYFSNSFSKSAPKFAYPRNDVFSRVHFSLLEIAGNWHERFFQNLKQEKLAWRGSVRCSRSIIDAVLPSSPLVY